MKALVAGVGNIFLSDDGFGVEVVRQLQSATLSDGVELTDFGIRGIHLAYQLMDGYDLLVVIDTVDKSAAPGTLFLIEAEANGTSQRQAAVSNGAIPLMDPHGMEPGAMLEMIGQLGAEVGRVVVVGCQPARLDEGIGLSPQCAAAVGAAAEMVLEVLQAAETQFEAREGERSKK